MSHYYTAEEAAKILKLSEAELRTCLRAALFPFPAKHRPLQFTFQDVLLLKTTKALCDAKIPLARIRRVLESLKRQLPEEQQLCTLKIYADGRRVVVWDGTAQWQPDSGQFLLNFESQDLARSRPVRAFRTRRPIPGRTAHQWLHLGIELEQESPAEARQAYREALLIDPTLLEARINLGFLYQRDGELDHAEECYRAAIRYAPDEILGYFTLARLLEEKGNRTDAIRIYLEILKRRPCDAEAHFHIAKL
ncbi:MAG: hypothetical protein C4294_01855, partial [Nitrospiraceae bacterium]